MAEDIRLWEVSGGENLKEIKATELDLEERLEVWLENDISILADNLLIIGRQVQTDFGGVVDLLCINDVGDLVIVELKRDKTPREITAQVLDYASWVANLSAERVVEIANTYLETRSTLEDAFLARFGEDLPDTLNQSHEILIVASEVDASSERIIKYLSSTYGVGINAATFQYFRDENGRQMLARVFLIEPEDRTGGDSKRRPNLTYGQLKDIAQQKGVEALYLHLVDGLAKHFPRTKTTRSSIGFIAPFGGGWRTVLNLLPPESDSKSGLRFQVYIHRLAHLLAVDREDAAASLPKTKEPWIYYPTAGQDYEGYTGFFKTSEEIEEFLSSLENPRAQ